MSEIILRDASAVSGLKHIILRYFNVARADPLGRTGQSTKNATHLIKAAVETAVGKRPKIEVYGEQSSYSEAALKLDAARGKLCIGLHRNIEVTDAPGNGA